TTRLFPAASIAFCGSSALLTAAKYNEFDAPLIDGITYFLSAAADFARMAIKLATALGVVCAVWNSFIAL
ncbi:MAG: hypothetical protein LBH85_09945, partial [Treponema sp.]|nr:hypothetical protein [Treponema sp.]